MFRKLLIKGETIVLSDEILNKLRHQEYIEKGKRIVKTLGLNDIYNKMTDDDFAMIADDFIYALNTTSDNISEMMEAAVQKITQRVENYCNHVDEQDTKDIQKNMESRKLIVNGQTIILSSEVINELHRQERIEEGKYMMEIFSSRKCNNSGGSNAMDAWKYKCNNWNQRSWRSYFQSFSWKSIRRIHCETRIYRRWLIDVRANL